MAQNYKEASQGLPTGEATKYAKGIQEMNALADSLQEQGELPERFSKSEAVVQAESLIKQEGPTIPNVYRKKQVEGLVFPSSNELVAQSPLIE
jgi:hypothetical protein